MVQRLRLLHAVGAAADHQRQFGLVVELDTARIKGVVGRYRHGYSEFPFARPAP